jgi:mono/diheme cytochrome c family protein
MHHRPPLAPSLGAAGLALLSAIACGDAREPAAPPAPPPAVTTPERPAAPEAAAQPAAPDASRGAVHYAQLCATCHGARGDADTPMAATLTPKPARHSDGVYMNALSDEHLFKVIKFGGPAVGKSPLMAAWGGALSDAQIRDVIAFVRTLADPPYVAPKR